MPFPCLSHLENQTTNPVLLQDKAHGTAHSRIIWKKEFTIEAVLQMTIHIVQPGDTVWKIAQIYGASPNRIISDNAIDNPRDLVIGQALLVLVPETVYTIRPGDTLSSISQALSVPVLTLLQNNPSLIDQPTLIPGQTIAVSFQGEKQREIAVNAYAYPNIRRDLLRRTLPYLTYLTIFGYGFTLDGNLIPIDDQPLINLAYEYKAAPVMLLSSITEDGAFSGDRASRLFQSKELQSRLFDRIIPLMIEKGYLGMDMDFEYINPSDRGAYLSFLSYAAQRLHANGFFLNTDLAPKTSSVQRGLLYEAHDYASIGAISDTVLLMTYEWGYTYGPPMAVAPINRVREVVEYAVFQIPADKILMGIPNYGYDWALPYERDTTRAVTIGNQYAIEVAGREGAQIQFDPTAQTPFFEYWDNRKRKHVVWFEDVRSIQAKFDLMDEYSLYGAGYWNAMRPFAQIWGYLYARYDFRKIVT